MMSENATPTCKQGDGIGLVSGSDISASQTPYMGQWMAHWSSSKDCQLHTDALIGNILQLKGHESLAFDRVISKDFKPVRIVMNPRDGFGGTGKSMSSAKDAPLSYALRSGETSEIDRGKFKIKENHSMGRDVESINDETTFSKKLSTQQLTESSIKWKNSGSYCSHSLDVSESDFGHFPMLDINRKIETILASKKKSAHGAVSVKMVKENLSLCESIGTSSLVELVPGSCLAAKKVIGDTEKVMTTHEGFLSDNAEDMDGAFSPVIDGCKYQKTNMVTCMFSSGLTYVDPINNKLTSMQHNLCSCCSSSKSMTTGIKSKTGFISNGFENSWITLKGESTHLLRESSLTDFPDAFSTEGHCSEVKGDSSSHLLLDQRRLGKPHGADVNHFPFKMPKCSIHDSGERFHKFSSTIKYLLISDKVGKYQCLREQTMKNSAFTQVNGSTLSRTITIPTKQNYGKNEKSIVPLENFVSVEDGIDWDDTGAHLVGKHEFSTKTDTIYNHSFHRSSSLLGESFCRPQMGGVSSNLRNSKATSASSAQVASRNVETGMAEEREVKHPASTLKETFASHKEASVSSTESLAADYIVSHVKVADVSSASPLLDHTPGSEKCSRWIKRLQDNHSETLSLCTKRFKKGYDSYSEIQQTFRRIQNYNPLSYGSHRFMNEQSKCEKTMKLSENVLSCGHSAESVQLWIRRWCRSDHEVSQTTSKPSVPLTFNPEKMSAPLENFDGKMSASIGAMALIGKAMNNYRPCRFRREEGSLVWNIEE